MNAAEVRLRQSSIRLNVVASKVLKSRERLSMEGAVSNDGRKIGSRGESEHRF